MKTALGSLVSVSVKLASWLAPVAVAASLAVGVAPAHAQCPPYSPSVSCGGLVVSLPYTLDWAGDEGGLEDGAAVGTGFTVVDNPSVRLTAAPPAGDGPSALVPAPACLGGPTPGAACNVRADCGVGGVCVYPGYEPSKLSVSGGALSIASNKGIQFKCPTAAQCPGGVAPTSGTSANTNSLINGLGVGFDPNVGRPIRIRAVVTAPTNGTTSSSQQAGPWVFVNEDNYIKLTVQASSLTKYKIQLAKEGAAVTGGAPNDEINSANDIVSAGDVVTLDMVIDALAGTVSAEYSINAGPIVTLQQGAVTTLSSSLGASMAAVFAGVDHDANGGTPSVTFAGLFATHRNGSVSLPWVFDAFSIAEEPLRVNFQSPSAAVPAGYVRDFGEPYGLRTGLNQGGGVLSYGWVEPGTSTPLDLSTGGTAGNGRDRNLLTDQRYDTLMHMQADDITPVFNGNPTEGAWEIALANGTYDVTIAVGDPSVGSDPENHRINLEGFNVIAGFVPSGPAGDPGRRFTATATITVSDGKLTMDATGGGVNTKPDFIDIVPGGPPECTTAGDCPVAPACGTSACVAGNCVAGVKPAGTTCRADVPGGCDVAETCDGVATTCPADGFAPASTVCRAAAPGGCDVAETCTGGSAACPADGFAPAGTVCRVGSGDSCDPTETCTGSGASCPANVVTAAGTTCRAAAPGGCDVAETCTGVAGQACPANGFAPASTVCRAAVPGGCDVAETCTGGSAACPGDGFAPSGTVCRVGSGDSCDPTETCTGSGASCPANVVTAAGTTCRAAAPGGCDVAETCTGVAGQACPANGFAPASTVCRAAAPGGCDVAETCPGGSAACPADGFAPASTVCRAAAPGGCDVVETCTGGSAACPADGFAAAGTVCRAGADLCDVAETCTGGSATCPADGVAPAGTQCRATTGVCDVAETCDGNNAACPPDAPAPDGTSCSDGNVCTVADACEAGVCTGDSVTCGNGTVEGGCGEECDDGNTTGDDGCDATCQLEVCPPTPGVGCRPPTVGRAAQLKVKRVPGSTKNQMKFKYKRGAATTKAEFGAPTATDDYWLCVYDAGALESTTRMEAAGDCGGRPCWKELSTGFLFKDKELTPDGAQQLKLREGADGKSSVQFKGKGAALDTPGAAVGPVVVQVRQAGGAACWEATFPAPFQKNDGTTFIDKTD